MIPHPRHTLYTVQQMDGQMAYALGDGTGRALMLGSREDVKGIAALLFDLLATHKEPPPMSPDHRALAQPALSVKECVSIAAEHGYGVSRAVVRSAFLNGKIHGARRAGTGWRISEDELLKWLARRAIGKPNSIKRAGG